MKHNTLYSGLITQSVLLHKGTCYLSALQIMGDGTHGGSVTLYDCMDVVQANNMYLIGTYPIAATSAFFIRDFMGKLKLHNGIYIALAGTGITCTLEWHPESPQEANHLLNLASMVYKVMQDIEAIRHQQNHALDVVKGAGGTAIANIASKVVL